MGIRATVTKARVGLLLAQKDVDYVAFTNLFTDIRRRLCFSSLVGI